jgi:hypothetical protein
MSILYYPRGKEAPPLNETSTRLSGATVIDRYLELVPWSKLWCEASLHLVCLEKVIIRSRRGGFRSYAEGTLLDSTSPNVRWSIHDKDDVWASIHAITAAQSLRENLAMGELRDRMTHALFWLGVKKSLQLRAWVGELFPKWMESVKEVLNDG